MGGGCSRQYAPSQGRFPRTRICPGRSRHPLVAIDLIVQIQIGACLSGSEQTSRPRGKWFVPGGVVRKYERLADAFARIVKAEIGLEASIADVKFVGVYEHLYDTNVFGEEGYGTHYLVLAYELNLGHRPPTVSDPQHSGFRWMTPAELISSPGVLRHCRRSTATLCSGRPPRR